MPSKMVVHGFRSIRKLDFTGVFILKNSSRIDDFGKKS